MLFFSKRFAALLTGAALCSSLFGALAQARSFDGSSKPVVLPGRIQQEQLAPEAEDPLQPIDPVPQWSVQKPVPHSAIAQGAVVPVVLNSPLELGQLRPGDLVSFQTAVDLLSGDGHWTIPKGSLAHAKVASWEWAQTGIKRIKIGLLFYEFVLPNGWVVPFEGYLLGMPKPKRHATPMALSMAQGQIPAGGPGVLMFSKYPLSLHPGEQKRLPAGEVFPLRVGQAIYYQAAMTNQDQRRRDRYAETTDRGVIPVSYPHFSDSAVQEIESYQDNALMPFSPDAP